MGTMGTMGTSTGKTTTITIYAQPGLAIENTDYVIITDTTVETNVYLIFNICLYKFLYKKIFILKIFFYIFSYIFFYIFIYIFI